MRFATTRWSMVLAAGAGPSEQADRALSELCAGYWHPLYAYVRQRGYDPDDACDLTQTFSSRRPSREIQTVRGLPLLHVAHNRERHAFDEPPAAVARGVVAGGDVAIGLVAVGGVALGGLTIGGLSLGVIGLGGVAAGLLMAAGGLAAGAYAAGGMAFGLVAAGFGARALLDLSPEAIRWVSFAAWGLLTAVVTAIAAGLAIWWRDAADRDP